MLGTFILVFVLIDNIVNVKIDIFLERNQMDNSTSGMVDKILLYYKY